MDSISVGDNGTTFAFLDNGAPCQGRPYFTFIAVHGLGFTSAVFKRVMGIASVVNIRFVAIARRGYQGSTPYTPAEITAATTGTDDEKAEFINARGLELASLIDKLIQQLALHPISNDGKTGGVGLLGWSSGTMWVLSALANIGRLPAESRSRMGVYIRATVLQDPPSVSLGLPLPPQFWSPSVDTTLPEEARLPFYIPWITSYFEHGDLSSRDTNEVNHHVPSTCRAPSIYNMSADEKKEIIDTEAIPTDWAVVFATQPQSNAIYRQACYDTVIRSMLPNMKIAVLVGGLTCAFAVNGMLSIQEDNEKYGGTIHSSTLPGGNHFMQWDDPKETLDAYMDAALQ